MLTFSVQMPTEQGLNWPASSTKLTKFQLWEIKSLRQSCGTPRKTPCLLSTRWEGLNFAKRQNSKSFIVSLLTKLRMEESSDKRKFLWCLWLFWIPKMGTGFSTCALLLAAKRFRCWNSFTTALSTRSRQPASLSPTTQMPSGLTCLLTRQGA